MSHIDSPTYHLVSDGKKSYEAEIFSQDLAIRVRTRDAKATIVTCGVERAEELGRLLIRAARAARRRRSRRGASG